MIYWNKSYVNVMSLSLSLSQNNIFHKFNAFSILTKHQWLLTFAVWGVTAKVAQFFFFFTVSRIEDSFFQQWI